LSNSYIISSSIVGPVLDHYVLVSGGGVRVSDVTRGEGYDVTGPDVRRGNPFN